MKPIILWGIILIIITIVSFGVGGIQDNRFMRFIENQIHEQKKGFEVTSKTIECFNQYSYFWKALQNASITNLLFLLSISLLCDPIEIVDLVIIFLISFYIYWIMWDGYYQKMNYGNNLILSLSEAIQVGNL